MEDQHLIINEQLTVFCVMSLILNGLTTDFADFLVLNHLPSLSYLLILPPRFV